MNGTLSTFLPLSFLIIAVIDDLCFKKFHNWLFIALSFVGLAYIFLNIEISLFQGLGGFIVGGALMLPLVLMGAIGAGDMKFMMCFGLIMGTVVIFEIFLYALFWGALIGVLQSLFAGKAKKLFTNMVGFAYKLKPAQTQKIPYTVAILFAWVSFKQFGGLL